MQLHFEVTNCDLKLYYRGMARLAAIAEQVETAAGLPPLPMPEDRAAATA